VRFDTLHKFLVLTATIVNIDAHLQKLSQR